MGYDLEEWLKRFENRSDITTTLTHLTREQVSEDGNVLSSVGVLLKILKERKINGSTGKGYIHGKCPAVCFQDAPAYGVGQNILHEETYRKELGGKIRYSANGLIFLKRYVYKKGGRPVFYDKLETAKRILPSPGTPKVNHVAISFFCTYLNLFKRQNGNTRVVLPFSIRWLELGNVQRGFNGINRLEHLANLVHHIES